MSCDGPQRESNDSTGGEYIEPVAGVQKLKLSLARSLLEGEVFHDSHVLHGVGTAVAFEGRREVADG